MAAPELGKCTVNCALKEEEEDPPEVMERWLKLCSAKLAKPGAKTGAASGGRGGDSASPRNNLFHLSDNEMGVFVELAKVQRRRRDDQFYTQDDFFTSFGVAGQIERWTIEPSRAELESPRCSKRIIAARR